MYKYQKLPIPLPQVYFKTMNTILLRFIWQGRKPRTSISVLTQDKRQGNLGVPDLKNYYKWVLLSRVIDWAKNNKNKRWVELESTISKAALGKIIWIPATLKTLGENIYKMTQKALEIWDLTHKKEKWGYNSPCIPLKDTEYFPLGKGSLFGNWIKKETAQLKDVLVKGRICTFQELKEKRFDDYRWVAVFPS